MPEVTAPRLVRGIIVGAEFNRLVVQATAAEVATFGRSQPVEVRPDPGTRLAGRVSPGELIDVTTMSDATRQLLPTGAERISIEAEGWFTRSGEFRS